MAALDSNAQEQQPEYFDFAVDIGGDIWGIHNHAMAGKALVCSVEGYHQSDELQAAESMLSSVVKELKDLATKIDESSFKYISVVNKSTHTALEADIEKSPNLAVMEKMKSMTEDQKVKFVRYSIRLLNNDPKLKRLTALYEKGQISIEQLMDMM